MPFEQDIISSPTEAPAFTEETPAPATTPPPASPAPPSGMLTTAPAAPPRTSPAPSAAIPASVGDPQAGGEPPMTMEDLVSFEESMKEFRPGALVKGRVVKVDADGVLVDVAHATEPLVRQAVKVAAKPLLLSHTALQGSKAQGETRLAGRQISAAHARMIADTGGVVGLWHFFPNIERYVDGIKEMVDVVGVDHTCIGTDQQVAKGAIQDYASFGSLADAMLKGGFNADETAKILGGNFVRIFGQALGTA